MDSQRFNLTRGGIFSKLMLVSVPIVGTQLMLMGYNLVDMFLLGRVGGDAVAASGSAGLFLWLSNGLMLVGRMGAEIGVAQAKGRRDRDGAMEFARNALFLAAGLGFAFALPCLFLPGRLIAFLNIQETAVAGAAADYLFIVAFGLPATFVAAAVSGIFTGSGNSRAPFFVNALGLALNALLDPLFIFTLGMGVRGAASATVISQLVACMLSLSWLLVRKTRPFEHFTLLRKPSPVRIRQIARWTVPVSFENMMFTFFAMVVARFVADYGAAAITVSRVGSQVESLSWLICLGFSSGITAFVGQNFGAGRWSRIWRGFRLSLTATLVWGLLVMSLFLLAGRWLTSLFVPDPHIVEMGGDYLWILAFCQIFFCLESIAGGAFRGLGRTAPPSIASVTTNALRVPLAYWFSRTPLGLNGIWWAVTLTASIRGLWVFLWFLRFSRGKPARDIPETSDSVVLREVHNTASMP